MNQKTTEVDFWAVIDDTNRHMKRLRWTEEKGKRFLLDRYGKNSRFKLSDRELLEFRDYLKTLHSSRLTVQRIRSKLNSPTKKHTSQ